jgi:NAD(P)H-hydrate epimerase
MQLPILPGGLESIRNFKGNLVVDAIFGTGLSSAPRPDFAPLAEAVNRLNKLILAIDIPSGLDCDSGLPLGPCIRATRTITFIAPKLGFANPQAKAYTGIVQVGTIGLVSRDSFPTITPHG